MKKDPDAWLNKPQPTKELCRCFHGIGCRIPHCGRPPTPFTLTLMVLAYWELQDSNSPLLWYTQQALKTVPSWQRFITLG